MGGTYTPENVVLLTISEHAEAHHQLFLEHGRLQDKMAWLMLSGRTEEGEQARVELIRLAHQSPTYRRHCSQAKKGHSVSQATRRKISKTKRENPYVVSDETREKYRTWLGRHHTKASRRKISKTLMGHPCSAETRKKLSAAKMGNTNRLGTGKK
jgi:hypothetical protein